MKQLQFFKTILGLLQQIFLLISDLFRELPKKIPIEKLAHAIKKFEGWYPGSRSFRNNNPGNLRSSKFQAGSADGFAFFNSHAIGWSALIWDLRQKCLGKTRTNLGPESTLHDLIFTWSETDQKVYLDFVCQQLGVAGDFQLKNFLL